jgi:hypothetical protein
MLYVGSPINKLTHSSGIMAEFASKIYTDLYDPRLLIYELDYIDDLTKKVHPPMHEGLPRTFSIVGNGILCPVHLDKLALIRMLHRHSHLTVQLLRRVLRHG